MVIDTTVKKGTVPFKPPREDLMGIAGIGEFLEGLTQVVPQDALTLDGVIPEMAETGIEDGPEVGLSVLEKKARGFKAPHGERTDR